MPTILIVDDEETHARALGRFLERRGYDVRVAISAEEACVALATARPDLTLLDQRLGDGDGLALLRDWHGVDPDLPVIVMTAYGSVETAVAAMKAGARDYLQKPIDLEELALVAEWALGDARTRAYLDHLQRGSLAGTGPKILLGGSPAMARVHDFLAGMAALDGMRAADHPTILLLGETGTGKSLMARLIHEASALARGPLVVVDCATLPHDMVEGELFGFERGAFRDAGAAKPGLLEIAAGGTVFIDEVAELGLAAQAKLLRVIEEKTLRRLGSLADIALDVRIVAATNRDLPREVEAGRFRAELFYRLNVLSLTLPPLRERGDDVVVLAAHFLALYARKYGRHAKTLAPDAIAALLAEPWRGNVRELAHAMERAMLTVDRDTLEARHLALGMRAPEEPAASSSLEEVERQLICRALEQNGGNVSRTARRLRVSRELLRYRMRKHGLGRA